MGKRQWLGFFCTAAFSAAFLGFPVRADVSLPEHLKAGDIITKDNIDKIQGLVSPGIDWCVQHGMNIKIGEYQKIEWPRRYKEATEKYSGQVKLASGGLGLENYVAGMPFPNIDPNDPQAALKIMWNYEYKFLITDDTLLHDFPGWTGTVNTDGPMTVERQFWVGDIRRMYYNGRLYVDPKPELPNPEGARFKNGLQPLEDPFDLKGVGGVDIRYIDPAKQDDSWLYLPQLRRVRRLSTAQRSDALFGQDADLDTWWGYNGHIAWMDWKLLGEKKILAIQHGENYPVKRCPPPGDFAFCDTWEPREVYVIEGTSKLPQYAYGKRIVFIDKEGWNVPYTDMYDRRMELWRSWVNNVQWKKKAAPWAKHQYEDDMGFYAAVFIVDVQLNHASYYPLPGPEPQNHECWFFNLGDKAKTARTPEGTSESWFTISHLVRAGH